jgi:hypothetical protein
VPRVGLFLDGAGQVPLRRRTFIITPVGVVHTVPRVTSRMALGVDFRF